MFYRLLSAITMIADVSGGAGPVIPEKETPPAIVKPKPLADSYKEQDRKTYKKVKELVESGSVVVLVMGLYQDTVPSTKENPAFHLWYPLDGFDPGTYLCYKVNGVCLMVKRTPVTTRYTVPSMGLTVRPDCPSCLPR